VKETRQPPASTWSNATPDPRKITSREMPVGLAGADVADDSLTVWAERYVTLAVRGARSVARSGLWRALGPASRSTSASSS
jgi:hypothetical protein